MSSSPFPALVEAACRADPGVQALEEWKHLLRQVQSGRVSDPSVLLLEVHEEDLLQITEEAFKAAKDTPTEFLVFILKGCDLIEVVKGFKLTRSKSMIAAYVRIRKAISKAISDPEEP